MADRDVYLRYHIAQRLMFWTDIPAEAFYGTDIGPPELPGPNGQYGHSQEKAPLSPEYPTFMRGDADDAEREIPGISGEREVSLHGRHGRHIPEEDDEDESEELMENTRANAVTRGQRDDRLNRSVQPTAPLQIPSQIAAMPDSIQQMVQGVKPRFAASQSVPQIQLQPSTASTLASSSGASFNFPRPDSTFSRASITSAPTRARPKAHLMKMPMDDTKLMPPKKSALRRASQFAGSPTESTHAVDLRKSTPDAESPIDRDASRRSMVRFDLHRMSTASTVSSSSVESLLVDILPAKPPKSKHGRAEPPAETIRLSAPSVDGIEHEGHRPPVTHARPQTRQRETRSRSPSRLSYLCSDGSSPDSPFADPAERSPVSTFADTLEFASASSVMEDEQDFDAKRKNGMSHLVL